MKALASWVNEWRWPVVILSVLAIMIWIDDRDERQRRAFEVAVMKQHIATHAELKEMKKEQQEYTDHKAADRFTGADAKNMESRIMSTVSKLFEHKQ